MHKSKRILFAVGFVQRWIEGAQTVGSYGVSFSPIVTFVSSSERKTLLGVPFVHLLGPRHVRVYGRKESE